MIELIADFKIKHLYIHIIQSDERYGWVMDTRPIHKDQYFWNGFHIGSGRDFSINLAEKFGSLPSCLADLKDALSYDHDIRRKESKDIINKALAIPS